MEDKKYWQYRPLTDKRRDWRNGGSNWIDEYKESKSHPHRQLVVNAITQIPEVKSILEVGCGCGPNIAYLREHLHYLKDYNLAGIDINENSIKVARDVSGVP